jgi:hypothetical protein
MSNEKEFQEPEEKEMNTQVMDDFSPFDEAISEKPYTRHNVRVDAKDFQNPIPEPSFMPPPMNGSNLSQEEKVKKEPPPPLNREMNELPKKDKHMAAEKVTEMFMSGYKFANSWADSKLLFDENKLAKMQRDGEIDLSVPIPYDDQQIPAHEFIREYNEQTKGTIVVSKEFEEEFPPVLTRILEKRGIGFTDEQYAIYLLSKDVLVKGFLFKQSLNVKKDMLNTMKELTSLLRGGATMPPPPPPQQTYQEQPRPSTPPPPQPSYTPSHNPDTNVNDFVNQMTGAYVPQTELVYEEPMVVDEVSSVEIIDDKKKGKRGRPKK